MRTQLTTLVMVASLLVSGQALAQPPQLPTFQPGDVLRANDLNAIVEQVRRNMPAPGGSGGATHTVDCASGTVAAAMSQAQPGDTIRITGTCNEAVVADKDGITLDGGGSAVIDGSGFDASVILVKGHQNVIIKGLIVQNGLIGVHVGLGASAWLENVTAKDSRFKAGHSSGVGILIANSSEATLTGAIAATGNASDGVLVWQGGRASVVGNLAFEGTRMPQASLQANDNTGNGIQVGLGSSLHVQAPDGQYSTLQANNNGGSGIALVTGSSAQFGGGADVEASGNGAPGLEVSRGSSVAFTVWPSRGVTASFNNNQGWAGISVHHASSLDLQYDNDAGASITAADNAGVGLGVNEHSSASFQSNLSQFASASLTFSGNGSYGGVGVYRNSAVTFRLPAEIKNNAGDGFNVWASGFVELGGDSDAAVTVADNGGNGITAMFTSSLVLGGATIENNSGHGVGIYDNGELSTFGQATTITGNGRDGISAWNGVGVYLFNTTVTGNTGADVSSGRGSRLGWSNSQVGTVYCDADVLTFDDASCPDEGGAAPEQ